MSRVSGWATARFGARQVWIALLATFMLGSVLAGLAWSVGALIAFRVIQGLGAGLLMPVGQAALAQTAGPDRMGRVMSLFGLPMLLIPTLARSSAERSPSTRAGGGSSTSTGR